MGDSTIELAQLLIESEERFALVMEASEAGYWDWDLQTDIVHLSKRWKEMLGYREDEIEDSFESWNVLVDDNGRVTTMALIDECLRGERDKFRTEFQMRHKDGSWVDILAYALVKRDKTGTGIRLICVHVDISDSKLRARVLEKSEYRYRMLFENMMDSFALHEIVLNEVGKPVDYIFRDMNSVLLQRVGLTKDDMIGKRGLELFPGTEKTWIDKFGAVALGGEPLHFTEYSAELDRYYETKAYSPEHGYFAATFADVTDQHRASDALLTAKNEAETSNRALTKLNLELEYRVSDRTADLSRSLKELKETQNKLIQTEKIAALGSLVGGIAHEINTPLGMVITAHSYNVEKFQDLKNLGIVEEREHPLLSEISEINQMITENLKRTAELVKAFRLTAVDEYSDQSKEFAVREIVDEAVGFSLMTHPEITCHVDIDCAPELILKSNPVYISSIVTNLLNNSLVHGFSDQENKQVRISLSLLDSIFTMVYTDNGSGIDPDFADSIFDPFTTTRRSEGSTGLGLNIIHNLIFKRMNGHIDYEAADDGGVVFTITAPMITDR